VRSRDLDFLGASIDAAGNDRASGGDAAARISHAPSRVQLWAIPTDEEGEIARELYALLHR
jgi:acetate kinase